MALGLQLKRLAKHSVIYGLGGIVSRILAVLLLPLYTSYLAGRDYGRVETLTALTAILVTLLRMGITSAFFRFYFDTKEIAGRLRVVRTSFWFTMVSATAGLAAGMSARHRRSPKFWRSARIRRTSCAPRSSGSGRG